MNARSILNRSGFTLIELITVVVIIGILAGIALPSFQKVTYRADAAKIVTDMAAVRLAVFEFREDNGRLPRTARWGETPPDLIPYLGQMPFVYKGVVYRVRGVDRTGKVEFIVRYPRSSRIGDALKKYRRPGRDSGSVLWTSGKTRFRLLVDNQ